MSDNKRDVLTLEKIIMMIGQTEKYVIEQGATINNLQPIFDKYRLKVHTFDALAERMLYKDEHPHPDSHATPFYCMTKNNQTYDLNHDTCI